MRILMFGWEFPPRMSGGLGTACFGMTKALAGLGHRITFVLPQAEETSASLFESRPRLRDPFFRRRSGRRRKRSSSGVSRSAPSLPC